MPISKTFEKMFQVLISNVGLISSINVLDKLFVNMFTIVNFNP